MKSIRPTLLFLICILAIVAIHYQFDFSQSLLPYPINLGGIVLVVIGLLLAVRVRKDFRRTFRESDELVKSGLYKFSRNPLYLAFAIALLGVWVLLGTFPSFFLFLLFIMVSHLWSIPNEERKMIRMFGSDYINYSFYVRRWI